MHGHVFVAGAHIDIEHQPGAGHQIRVIGRPGFLGL